MPPPLNNDQIAYTDGAPTTVEQYAKDVSAFLAWTAEPHMERAQAHRLSGHDFLIVFAWPSLFCKEENLEGRAGPA